VAQKPTQPKIMKFIKLATFLLSAALLGSAVSGCGQSDEDTAATAVEDAADAME
jgi:outer membrane lipoprotein-sorting protein